MPVFTRPDAEIYYEVHGSGFPLLLFAPGGLRSQLEYWRHSPSAPDAVLQNPIGLHENRDTWDDSVSNFAKTMLARDPSLTEENIQKFGHNMIGGDFVFSVAREFVRHCRTPLLLQPGSDKPHPAETSAEIARLAPNLEVQKDWRGPTHLAESIGRVTDFLTRNTPKP